MERDQFLQKCTKYANEKRKKLGIEAPIVVVLDGTICTDFVQDKSETKIEQEISYGLSHAHCELFNDDNGNLYRVICLHRKERREWKSIIRHEVAHFIEGSNGHDILWREAYLKLERPILKRQLRKQGIIFSKIEMSERGFEVT